MQKYLEIPQIVVFQQRSDLGSQLAVKQEVRRAFRRFHIVPIDRQDKSATAWAGEQSDVAIVFPLCVVLRIELIATGAAFNFVASRANIVGPAVSYSIGQGATMISAAWGVFVWKEFSDAPHTARIFLVWMFVPFPGGLTLIALAPLYWARPSGSFRPDRSRGKEVRSPVGPLLPSNHAQYFLLYANRSS